MKFGISTSFPCNYLPNKQERLLIYHDENGDKPASPEIYGNLMKAGFRRSGSQVYRPHCEVCQACQSLRLDTLSFQPSKSQKRIRGKNKDIAVKVHTEYQPEFYPLYSHYISKIHKDGGMYPPSEEQLRFFTQCDWMSPLFICLYDKDVLIAVAVTDELPDALSALYTFYDPDRADLSLGTFSILTQINVAKYLSKRFLYLGYYIEESNKMKYKNNFLPNQRFIDNEWQEFVKNSR